LDSIKGVLQRKQRFWVFRCILRRKKLNSNELCCVTTSAHFVIKKILNLGGLWPCNRLVMKKFRKPSTLIILFALSGLFVVPADAARRTGFTPPTGPATSGNAISPP
jgi:hypothetical protein